mmetsp:Transcript_4006/g.9336  ORF Transcript_4006/g.9336 Transcript_4006/m.9336 type:complete len:295 (+) Transcript_4006:2290-3174(+)
MCLRLATAPPCLQPSSSMSLPARSRPQGSHDTASGGPSSLELPSSSGSTCASSTRFSCLPMTHGTRNICFASTRSKSEAFVRHASISFQVGIGKRTSCVSRRVSKAWAAMAACMASQMESSRKTKAPVMDNALPIISQSGVLSGSLPSHQSTTVNPSMRTFTSRYTCILYSVKEIRSRTSSRQRPPCSILNLMSCNSFRSLISRSNRKLSRLYSKMALPPMPTDARPAATVLAMVTRKNAPSQRGDGTSASSVPQCDARLSVMSSRGRWQKQPRRPPRPWKTATAGPRRPFGRS